MTSALGFALLGLLARHPATGYDLTRTMDIETGYFWTARHSQVYPELARLAEAGLVSYAVVPGAGPRDTKEYRLTDDGRDALVEWVTSDPEAVVERDPVLLRVSSLWLAEPAAAEQFLRRVRERSRARLALYRSIADELDREAGSADPAAPGFSVRATVQAGIVFHLGRIDWCEWMLRRARHPA